MFPRYTEALKRRFIPRTLVYIDGRLIRAFPEGIPDEAICLERRPTRSDPDSQDIPSLHVNGRSDNPPLTINPHLGLINRQLVTLAEFEREQPGSPMTSLPYRRMTHPLTR
ncbi:MAG: hypothetical protein ACP5FL_04620 [Thermoplasmatota archaeon]